MAVTTKQTYHFHGSIQADGNQPPKPRHVVTVAPNQVGGWVSRAWYPETKITSTWKWMVDGWNIPKKLTGISWTWMTMEYDEVFVSGFGILCPFSVAFAVSFREGNQTPRVGLWIRKCTCSKISSGLMFVSSDKRYETLGGNAAMNVH